ncbi:MAG: class I SAM-dependent methyltransferase [Acidobacteriales bacterium]|nr:class I SAM-dependent methyltransferase [Terriglobales bacterium]
MLSVSLAASPAASEILNKYTVATGGRAAAERIKTSVREGTFQYAPRTEFQVLIEAARDGQWHTVLTLAEDIRFEEVFDGKAGWEHTPEQTFPMDAKTLDSDDPVFNLDALAHPERYFAGFAMKGRENSGGRDVWVLEGSRSGGTSTRALFDVETGLLNRIGNVIVEDYREVDGVKVPHRLRFVEKRGEQVMQFTRVRHNVPIPAAHFDKEQSATAYRQAVREATLKALAKRLDGIDAGPARAVLERMHNFTAEDGRLLYDIVVKNGCLRGLEVGTAEGNSALWMGMAFRTNGGRLVTIDRNAERTKVAVENFKQAGLAEIIDCRTADAFAEIAKIEGSFDFLFLDTGAPIHKKLLDLVYARLAPGAVIVSHNANTLERMEPAFWKAAHEDPNLETSVTYTRGGGLLVARKKPRQAR